MKADAERLSVWEANISRALQHYHARTGSPDLAFVSDAAIGELLAESDDGETADEDEMDRRRLICRVLFRFFLGEGPHPSKILKRVFAVGRALRMPFFTELSMTEAALMLGETKAAHSYRMKTLSGLIKRTGQHGVRLSGQKSSQASAAYSAAQRGNTNRRGKRNR